MLNKPKKTRILSLSIIEKAIAAIENKPDDKSDLFEIAQKYNLVPLFKYYDDVVEELEYQFNKRKADLIKINELFITRERLHRILNPTIYLNAYKEKRANDAIYINANVGFIDEKGKVKNVVVFMGKSPETDLNKLKDKIETDHKFIEESKKKVLEKLVSKIDIPIITTTENFDRRRYKLDEKPLLTLMEELLVKSLVSASKNIKKSRSEKNETLEKKSIESLISITNALVKKLEDFNAKD